MKKCLMLESYLIYVKVLNINEKPRYIYCESGWKLEERGNIL